MNLPNVDFARYSQAVQRGVVEYWKPTVGMVGVAIIVGKVWGRTAVFGLVLIYASAIQTAGPVLRVITWVDLKSTIGPLLVAANLYYKIIPPTWINYYFLGNWAAMQYSFWSTFTQLSSRCEELRRQNDNAKRDVGVFKEHVLKFMAQVEVLRQTASGAQDQQMDYQQKVAAAKAALLQQTQDIAALADQWSKTLALVNEQPAESDQAWLFVDQLREQAQKLQSEIGGLEGAKKQLTAQVEGLSAAMEEVVPLLEQRATSSTDVLATLRAEIQRLKSIH